MTSHRRGGSAPVDVVVLTSAYHARRVRGVAVLLLGFYGLSFHVAEVELYLGVQRWKSLGWSKKWKNVNYVNSGVCTPPGWGRIKFDSK